MGFIKWLKYIPWLFFWVKYFPRSNNTYKALARVKDIFYDPINVTANLVVEILKKTGPLIQRGAALLALLIAAIIGADIGVDYGRNNTSNFNPPQINTPPIVEPSNNNLEQVNIIEEVEEIDEPNLVDEIEKDHKKIENNQFNQKRGQRKIIKRIEWRAKKQSKIDKKIFEQFTINSSGVNGY